MKNTISVVLTMVAIMMAACKYDEVLPKEPDPGVVISFSEDILPIFNGSCNFSGCHNASGPAPDLRPSVAYSNLVDAYIDLETPENSELYQWMIGARRLPMPVQGVNATQAATILEWIRQGALNN